MLSRVLWHCWELSRNEWLSPMELQRLQEKKLRAIIRYVYENVPIYHSKFDAAGVKPDDVRSIRDLRKLPFTTKEEVRSGIPDRSIARGYDIDDCVKLSTSGTSGGPMPVFLDRRAWDIHVAHRHFRRLRFMGLEPWDKLMQIYYHRAGAEHLRKENTAKRESEEGSRGREALGPSVSIFRRWLRRVYIAYDAEEILASILEYRPGIIEANPSYLRLIAECMREKGIAEIRPKALLSRAEVLDEPTRKYLESVFECPVFNDYGAFESPPIACECKQREGLHITSDMLVMEVVRDGETVGPDEEGEIVLTGLVNHAMPLIRYRLGDIGILDGELCSCGRGLPLLKSIEGRIVDFLTLPDGRKVSPKDIAAEVQSIGGVSRYQLVQENLNKVTIELMRRRDDPEVSIDDLTARCHKVLGNEIEIEILIGDRDRLKAKFRPVISKLTVAGETRWTKPRAG